jgi:hypothetical protein
MTVGRKTGGRKLGVKNKSTIEKRRALAAAVSKFQKKNKGNVFEGDALGLLVLVYKDNDLPLAMRMAAAQVAIRYEKPALSAVQHGGKDDGPIEGRITIEFVEPPKRKEKAQ